MALMIVCVAIIGVRGIDHITVEDDYMVVVEKTVVSVEDLYVDYGEMFKEHTFSIGSKDPFEVAVLPTYRMEKG